MDAQTIPSPQATSAAATLDSFGHQLQDLPMSSLVPAGMLLLLGLLLLVAGRHFLRPVLVVAIVLFSAMLGVPVLGGLLPNLHGLVLTALGALIGALVAAVAWRLFLGAALGVVLAFSCALLALLGTDAGFIDARSANDRPPSVVTLAEIADRDAIVERSPSMVRPLVAWAEAKWHAEPAQVQTLLKAAAFGGAFVGLVLGTWLPQGSAAFLTSLVGSLFTLLGGMPFLLRALDRSDAPVRPAAWLLLWLSLAGAGWLLQSWRRERAGGESSEADKTKGPGGTRKASDDSAVENG